MSIPTTSSGGPTFGTQYDLGPACELCGTGAVQVGPLILDPSDTPRNTEIFATLDHEILVSASVADALEDAAFDGMELRQVVARDGGDLGWFQIVARREMPSWAAATTGFLRERPCTRCNRDGYFNTVTAPLQIRYDQETLARAPDVTWTYERFGNSVLRDEFAESHFAAPRTLVAPRVLDAIGERAARRCACTPVSATA
jgi:hypothetical protein